MHVALLVHAPKGLFGVFVGRCADADEGWHVDDLGLTAAVVVWMVEKDCPSRTTGGTGPSACGAHVRVAWARASSR